MATEDVLRIAEALEAAGRDVKNTTANRALDMRNDDAVNFRAGIHFTVACCEIALNQAREAARQYGIDL